MLAILVFSAIFNIAGILIFYVKLLRFILRLNDRGVFSSKDQQDELILHGV